MSEVKSKPALSTKSRDDFCIFFQLSYVITSIIKELHQGQHRRCILNYWKKKGFNPRIPGKSKYKKFDEVRLDRLTK